MDLDRVVWRRVEARGGPSLRVAEVPGGDLIMVDGIGLAFVPAADAPPPLDADPGPEPAKAWKPPRGYAARLGKYGSKLASLDPSGTAWAETWADYLERIVSLGASPERARADLQAAARRASEG